jgi:uncharacterized protein (TIGR02145 family)
MKQKIVKTGLLLALGAATTVFNSCVSVREVSLNKPTLHLVVGKSETLTETVKVIPVTWTSDNPAAVTVDSAGKVTAISAGAAVITVKAGDKTATSTVVVGERYVPALPCEHKKPLPDGVEIGGIVWATRNVGAVGKFVEKPEDPGMLYQWGSNIPWNTISPERPLWPLTPNTEAAWEKDPCPEGWRVPTYDELQKLVITFSGWTHTPAGGTFSSGDNCIFLPAAGARDHTGRLEGIDAESEYGYYWSSTPNKNNTLACAISLHRSYNVYWKDDHRRLNAYCVRCVKK